VFLFYFCKKNLHFFFRFVSVKTKTRIIISRTLLLFPKAGAKIKNLILILQIFFQTFFSGQSFVCRINTSTPDILPSKGFPLKAGAKIRKTFSILQAFREKKFFPKFQRIVSVLFNHSASIQIIRAFR
jgi:hypothetical protein